MNKYFFLVLGLILVGRNLGLAQQPVTGIVVDQSGGAIVGAQVNVLNASGSHAANDNDERQRTILLMGLPSRPGKR